MRQSTKIWTIKRAKKAKTKFVKTLRENFAKAALILLWALFATYRCDINKDKAETSKVEKSLLNEAYDKLLNEAYFCDTITHTRPEEMLISVCRTKISAVSTNYNSDIVLFENVLTYFWIEDKRNLVVVHKK